MNIIVTILLVLAGIIALLLVAALFMKREHYVKREIIIHAPRQIKNQEKFNKYAKADPDRKEIIKGIDGTVGYIYAWSGNKNAGEGEKEIMNIVEGKSIETEIRFVKPMITSATIIMETESISDTQTRVSWSNAGTLKYPVNIMIPMLEKSLPKDMDSSLSTLKTILEK
jgi:hypothetical protein